MMLYTKYESSGPCSFRQEDFWKFYFKNLYILTQWPTYATNWNGLNNFDRGPPRDHSCEVWSNSHKWLKRRCCLKKLLTDARTDARTTDAGHWRITKAYLSTSCSGELKSCALIRALSTSSVSTRSSLFLSANQYRQRGNSSKRK